MIFDYCPYTGLLYIDDVPFTVERIKHVVDIIDYSMNNQRQFDYGVTIHDKLNGGTGGTVTIDNSNIDEFLQAVADNSGRIAKDKDFK